MRTGKELGSTLHEIKNEDGVVGVSYSKPREGNVESVDPSPAPKGAKTVGIIHLHGKCFKSDFGAHGNMYSGADQDMVRPVNMHKKDDDDLAIIGLLSYLSTGSVHFFL